MTLISPLRPLILGLALAAGPSLAETPLTASDFEAHVLGKTISYSDLNGVFGTEEYLADRQVRWSVAPNLCQYGTWYPEGDDICFVYTDDPAPSCWTFWLKDGVLLAKSANNGSVTELVETAATDQGLPCPGPDVGV